MIASTLLLSGSLVVSSEACRKISSVTFLFLSSPSEIAANVRALGGGLLSYRRGRNHDQVHWQRKHPSPFAEGLSADWGCLFLSETLTGCNSVFWTEKSQSASRQSEQSFFKSYFSISLRNSKNIVSLLGHAKCWLSRWPLRRRAVDFLWPLRAQSVLNSLAVNCRDDAGLRVSVLLCFPLKVLSPLQRPLCFHTDN